MPQYELYNLEYGDEENLYEQKKTSCGYLRTINKTERAIVSFKMKSVSYFWILPPLTSIIIHLNAWTDPIDPNASVLSTYVYWITHEVNVEQRKLLEWGTGQPEICWWNNKRKFKWIYKFSIEKIQLLYLI